MKIRGLYPESFGKLQRQEVRFDDGINVIHGSNEAGKTTLRSFLVAMLFGWEKGRGKADPYTRYLPWDAPGAYRGAMELEVGGEEYRVERNFLTTEPSLRVYRKPSLREVSAEGGLLPALGSSLTRAGYENTALFPQGSANPDGELAKIFANYVANMQSSRNSGVDVAGALESLAAQRKALEKKKLPEAEAALVTKIETLRAKIAERDRLAEDRARLTEELAETERRLSLCDDTAEREQPALIERLSAEYDTYMKSENAADRQEELLDDTEKQIEAALRELPDTDELRAKERRLDELLRQRVAADAEWKANTEELQRRREFHAGRKKLYGFLVKAGVVMTILGLVAVVMAFSGKSEWRQSMRPYAIGAALCGVLITGLSLFRRSSEKWELSRIDANSKLPGNAGVLPERIREEIAALPTEEELHRQIENAVAVQARAEAGREQLQRQRDELATERERLLAERERLLEAWSAVEPMADLTDAAVAQIRSQAEAKRTENAAVRRELTERKDLLRAKLERLEVQIEAAQELDASLYDSENELSAVKKQREADEIDRQALALAEERIRTISAKIHDSFGVEFGSLLSKLAEETTSGAHAKIVADEKLAVKTEGTYRAASIDSLSAGAAEQLYLALRLAVAEKMYGAEHLPLVFDDSFVYYDSVRLRSTLAMIAARGEQVLLFTCSERESEALTELGIPFRQIEL